MSALPPAIARRLATRRPLRVDAGAAIAIKRNLHEATVAADADRFAAAFAEVMADPARRFAGIRVKRLRARVGRPFTPGERFQGCFSLVDAANARGLVLPAPLRHALAWFEDRALSDYAEIVSVSPRAARYRYLEGTPMAGESAFEISPLGPGRCRFTARFEYQELGTLAVALLHGFAVAAHDRVVLAQVEAAAALVGGRVEAHTFPVA